MAQIVQEAELSLSAGQYQQAVSKYLQAASEWPSCRPRIKEQLLTALSHVTNNLNLAHPSHSAQAHSSCSSGVSNTTGGRKLTPDQLLFSQLSGSMCSMFADHADAMTMLGVKCLDEGVYNQAEFFFRVALEADSDYLSAKENLRVLFDRVVNRWHFHMLNDMQRNSTYFRAIHSAVRAIPNCAVLDIGSGTGILSMMAKRSGAERVYACEISDAMVRLSCEALTANGLADSVTVLHSLSTMLSIPKDIPNRVNLVVTEIVDAGLLGEYIIPTLRHAWKELLLPCKTDQASNHMTLRGHVIPCGALVHAMAIECPEIRRRSRLTGSEIGGIKVIPVSFEGSCKILEGASGRSSSGKELTREPYTCERLTQIRGGYRALTAASPVLQLDFTNPEIPLPESQVSLPVIATGQLDAIAVWFDLHLDSQNSFSTSPNWDISWEQAIFPTRHEVHVQERDIVQLHASCTDTLLQMEIVGINAAHKDSKLESGGELSVNENTQQRQTFSPKQSAKATKLKADEKLCAESMNAVDRTPLFYVERSELCRWNDSDYIECYRKSLAQAVEAVRNGDLEREGEEEESESEEESSGTEMDEDLANCLVLDMTHGLSPFGLMAAKEGADFVQIGRTHEIYGSLIELLAQSNNLADHVSFRYLDLTGTSHSQVMWDIVVCDMINPQGELRAGMLEELAFIRSTSFHSSSLIIPGHMTVHAALISSPALRANSLVLGTVPTLGFNVARFINKYQVSHYTDLDLSSWPHQMLTESCEVMRVDLNTLPKKPLKVERKVAVEVKAAGTAVGIAYWFTLHMYGDITISTYQPELSTSHWHQSVFLLPEDVNVSTGQTVTLRALLRDSYLDITMVTD